MQIQTRTKTMPVQNINFQITSFEQTTTAFCDCCDNQATATKDELKRRGWGFAQGSEFCPDCNF